MKRIAWVLLGLVALAAVGCDNRSESEKAMAKMKSDMNKAVDNL